MFEFFVSVSTFNLVIKDKVTTNTDTPHTDRQVLPLGRASSHHHIQKGR